MVTQRRNTPVRILPSCSDGKPLDYTQARYWYEQSAEQENPRANKLDHMWL